MQTKFGEMSELQSARTDEGPRPKWMRRMVEDDEMTDKVELNGKYEPIKMAHYYACGCEIIACFHENVPKHCPNHPWAKIVWRGNAEAPAPEWDGVAEEIFKDALWSMAPEWAEGFGAIRGKPVWFSRTQYAWVGVVGRNACRFEVSTNYQMTDITVMLWRTWNDTREETIDAAVRLERSWMTARKFAEALYDAGMLRKGEGPTQ